MELPPLHNTPLTSPTRAAPASSLLDLAALPAGSKLSATVESVTPLTSKLRGQLLAYFSGESKTSPESQKSVMAALSKSELFAVQLSALGKRVLTFSELALPLKEKVPVTVRPDGQLHINTAATHKSSLGASLSTAALASNTGALYTASPRDGAYKENASMSAVNEGLRRYLPLQTPLSQAFKQLQTMEANVATEIRQLTTAAQNTNQPQSNLQLRRLLVRINALAHRAPSIDTLGQPAQLKRSIINSGAFLEAKLGSNLSLNPPANSAGFADSKRMPTEDLKAELLKLIADISKLPSPANSAKSSVTNTIDKLLQALFAGPRARGTSAEAKQHTSPSALSASQQALPALISALARISSLQIRQLNQVQSEPGAQPNGAQLELPVRIGEHFYPLSLHFQEKIVEQKHAEDQPEKASKKGALNKKWHVFMEFDLEEYGNFASDIEVQENRVTTRLWVQKEALWKTSSQHLSDLQGDLEDAGIVVEQLSCQRGNAPERKTQVRQSLVDVRT